MSAPIPVFQRATHLVARGTPEALREFMERSMVDGACAETVSRAVDRGILDVLTEHGPVYLWPATWP